MRMVERIMNKFGEVRDDEAADRQRDFAFGTAVCIGFKILLRYDDLSRCRWDKGLREILRTHITFYLSGRKNKKYKGEFWTSPPRGAAQAKASTTWRCGRSACSRLDSCCHT